MSPCPTGGGGGAVLRCSQVSWVEGMKQKISKTGQIDLNKFRRNSEQFLTTQSAFENGIRFLCFEVLQESSLEVNDSFLSLVEIVKKKTLARMEGCQFGSMDWC